MSQSDFVVTSQWTYCYELSWWHQGEFTVTSQWTYCCDVAMVSPGYVCCDITMGPIVMTLPWCHQGDFAVTSQWTLLLWRCHGVTRASLLWHHNGSIVMTLPWCLSPGWKLVWHHNVLFIIELPWSHQGIITMMSQWTFCFKQIWRDSSYMICEWDIVTLHLGCLHLDIIITFIIQIMVMFFQIHKLVILQKEQEVQSKTAAAPTYIAWQFNSNSQLLTPNWLQNNVPFKCDYFRI